MKHLKVLTAKEGPAKANKCEAKTEIFSKLEGKDQ